MSKRLKLTSIVSVYSFLLIEQGSLEMSTYYALFQMAFASLVVWDIQVHLYNVLYVSCKLWSTMSTPSENMQNILKLLTSHDGQHKLRTHTHRIIISLQTKRESIFRFEIVLFLLIENLCCEMQNSMLFNNYQL